MEDRCWPRGWLAKQNESWLLSRVLTRKRRGDRKLRDTEQPDAKVAGSTVQTRTTGWLSDSQCHTHFGQAAAEVGRVEFVCEELQTRRASDEELLAPKQSVIAEHAALVALTVDVEREQSSNLLDELKNTTQFTKVDFISFTDRL